MRINGKKNGVFVLLNLGVARIGAARASAFALLVPVVGVLTSVMFLGDEIGPLTVVGGAIGHEIRYRIARVSGDAEESPRGD